jgi:energy-coupling factor transporter ATP-binding protein EcfA2
MPKISLKSNERVLIAGKTGSGKTYLARYITDPLKRLVVLDGKGTLSGWGLDTFNPSTMRELIAGKPARLRAIPGMNENPAEYCEQVLQACYLAGNITIYIDELYAIAPPNKKPPDSLWSIYTRGRELGIGVWAATQRPVWIPLFTMSESEHFFLFRLQLEEDRARMSAFMGERVIETIKDPHGFYYSRADSDYPEYVKQLQITSQGGKLLKTENAPLKPIQAPGPRQIKKQLERSSIP